MPTLIQVMYGVSAAQALFVCLLLYTRAPRGRANRALAAMMLALSISACYVLAARAGWLREHAGWVFAIDTLPALYGPLTYLYVCAVLEREVPPRWVALHLAPFAAYTLYDVPRFVLPGAAKLALDREEAHHLALDQAFWQWGVELQGLGYFLACTWLVAQAWRSSERQSPALRWLATFVGALLCLWLGSMLARATHWPILVYVHGPLTLLIYAIAYLNVARPELFQPSNTSTPAAATPVTAADGGARYEKDRLKDELAEQLALRLQTLVDRDKPYLDPDFALARLAEQLGVSPHHTSQLLNARFGRSFHDYVNQLRVNELQRRLVDPAFAHEKVLTIGLACGFSSKSTLNSNFRKWTGLTPTEYRTRAAHSGE
ncbi:MAG: helix-turn-helix transcriptional regulator [Polyangiales bacterium]